MKWSKRFVQVIVGDVTAAAAGFSHNMVAKEDGSVWITGSNSKGELGIASTTNRDLFFLVQRFTSNAKAIAAGGYHSIVLTRDGYVFATGWNKYGQ